jgi:hypothetical protein
LIRLQNQAPFKEGVVFLSKRIARRKAAIALNKLNYTHDAGLSQRNSETAARAARERRIGLAC